MNYDNKDNDKGNGHNGHDDYDHQKGMEGQIWKKGGEKDGGGNNVLYIMKTMGGK